MPLVIAALLALYINAPRKQASIDVVRSTLKGDFRDWPRRDENFEVSAFCTFVHLLDDLTARNRSISRWLTGALGWNLRRFSVSQVRS
jgi:hypothetical protein